MIDSRPPAEDRNFDDLAHRFRRNVYASLKGQIRLRVLARDFEEFLPEQQGGQALQVLDAGGGQGQMAGHFAALGHNVLLCDISRQMLALAQESLAGQQFAGSIELKQQSIQEIAASGARYDVVVCHAVLEWAAEPQGLLNRLVDLVKPGGALSLIYYNLNGLIYKNLLRTNFKKIRREQWRGYRGSLTPSSPLRPEQISLWLEPLPLEVECESGIRVFYDYIFDLQDRSRDPDGIIEMELAHSRLPPFKHLGRYVHLLCRKHAEASAS